MAVMEREWNDAYPGIIISNDDAVNLTFRLTLDEQLKLIASKPVGALLLKKIAESRVVTTMAYKVKIQRAKNTLDMSETDPAKRWHAGNVTKGVNMDKAKNGAGTPSVITYNPNVFLTPDGKRPPYIGLAHELIHAYRNLYGISGGTTATDESMVCGFGQYKDEDITENKIRAEHGIDDRTGYAGVI